MPCGTIFVYLGILLVYLYLVYLLTKNLNYFFFLTSFLPITWFV